MALPSLESISLQSTQSVDLLSLLPKCPFIDDSENFIHNDDWHKTGWIGRFHLDYVLSSAIQKGASDVHLMVDSEIYFTILGDVCVQKEFGILDEDLLEDLVRNMISNEIMGNFVKDLECDTIYKIRFGPYEDRRFRVNIGKSFRSNLLTFRIIQDYIPTVDSLGISNEILNLFDNSSGVVLVCGPTGSGKSTTLASIIRDIQMKKQKKIITIEKPIEFIYPKGRSMIVQRSIPEDCLDFEYGLTSAMRSAPNIILIGEVRNKHEVDELLRASETGHLSVSTIHTSNNITTLNRIRSLYEGSEQKRVLSTLGDNLKGIVNQVLVKSIDGKSRFAVQEVLVVDFSIRKFIQEDNFLQIRKLQELSKSTMEHKLVDLVNLGKCTLQEAREKSPDKTYFDYLFDMSKKERIENE